MVSSGQDPTLFHINMKYMGKRGNYIRVRSQSRESYQYVESVNVTSHESIDTAYYYNNIKTSLRTVTEPLHVDLDPIYSGYIMGNGWYRCEVP